MSSVTRLALHIKRGEPLPARNAGCMALHAKVQSLPTMPCGDFRWSEGKQCCAAICTVYRFPVVAGLTQSLPRLAAVGSRKVPGCRAGRDQEHASPESGCSACCCDPDAPRALFRQPHRGPHPGRVAPTTRRALAGAAHTTTHTHTSTSKSDQLEGFAPVGHCATSPR